jgi:hypothetical protein
MPMPQPGGTQQTPPAAADENGPKRTEFVILFVWKEPADSDDLRGLKASGQEGGAAKPGGKAGAGAGASSPPRARRPRKGGGGGGDRGGRRSKGD